MESVALESEVLRVGISRKPCWLNSASMGSTLETATAAAALARTWCSLPATKSVRMKVLSLLVKEALWGRDAPREKNDYFA
jgi:hypothetical protein